MTIRIGQIDYANCVPLFKALKSESGSDRYLYIRGVPTELNQLLDKGDIDLCPSSSIVYAKDPSRYSLLPGLSISSEGAVGSVLLFSRKPLEELDGCEIGLTTESDTSVALLRIILGRFYGFSNRFSRSEKPLHEALSQFSGLLLIGDSALRESLCKHNCYVYDLGELWRRFTGLPFVFALWIVNRLSVEKNYSELQELARTLHQSKKIAEERLADYAKEEATLPWITVEELITYWRTISYELGDNQIAGLNSFYMHAAEMGIIRRAPDLTFISI